MKKRVILLGTVITEAILCFTLCSCNLFGIPRQVDTEKQVETVIVKETVFVDEPDLKSIASTEGSAEASTEASTVTATEVSTEAQGEESTKKVGITTADILRKAAEESRYQYWFVYYEASRYNRIEMASFDALEGFTVKLYATGRIRCDKLVDNGEISYWSSDKNSFIRFENTFYLAYNANGIIGGNCDIYDEKNDNVIEAKTE